MKFFLSVLIAISATTISLGASTCDSGSCDSRRVSRRVTIERQFRPLIRERIIRDRSCGGRLRRTEARRGWLRITRERTTSASVGLGCE